MRPLKIILTLGEIIGIAAVPLVLIFFNYTSWDASAFKFKIGITGVVLILLVVWLVKKLLLKKYLDRLSGMLTQHLADLKTETDALKIANLKASIRTEATVEKVCNAIMPAIVLAGLYLLCRALETSAIQLSGTVGFICVSVMIGFLLGMINAQIVVKK